MDPIPRYRGEPASGPRRHLTAAEAFTAHQPELARYLTRLTHDPEEAAELSQEAFLRLVREEQVGRGPDQVRAWLYRVATNLAMSRARRRAVAQRHAEALGREWSESINAQNDVIGRDDWRRTRLVLEELPTDARTAVVLAAEGYTSREISRRIGRSEPATRTLICRARGQLRRRLAATEAADVGAHSAARPRGVRTSWAAPVRA